MKSFSGDDERELLIAFADLLRKWGSDHQKCLCAHNGKDFDFPYLCRRMIIQGIMVPPLLNIAGKKPYEICDAGVGRTFQVVRPFRRMTVLENVVVGAYVHTASDKAAREIAEEALTRVGLSEIAQTLAGSLSNKQLRLLEIARALATSPSFMLLDEPFAGIDPIAVGDIQELVRLLKQRGIGVLITDHNVRETLGLVDRAYIVHSGTILMEGLPEEIVESREVRRLYLGEEFRL